MAGYENKSGGVIILPDGKKIAPGDTAQIGSDALKSSGVLAMIKSGALAEKPVEKPRAKQERASGE